jgi:hypothetical protein
MSAISSTPPTLPTSSFFDIQKMTSTGLIVFIMFLGAQMFFSMVTAAIVVNDEKDKNNEKSAKSVYGIILIITSIIWMIVLLIAFMKAIKGTKGSF